jgi:hypothetical protein
VFHGSDHDDVKPLVLRHFQRVDEALRVLLRGDQAPVVIAGVRCLRALYQKANAHQVWPFVEPVLREQEVAAANTYRALQGTGRTSREPTEALAAARQGRVETLFVSTDAPEWRTRASGGPLIGLGDTPSAGEQLDIAAVATLDHAGAVYAVPAPRMPDTNPVAAILRY